MIEVAYRFSKKESRGMFNSRLGISLISMASLACTFLWFATTPGLSLEQTVSPKPNSSVAVAEGDGTTFAGRIKASLSEAVEEVSHEKRVSHTAAPSRMKPPEQANKKSGKLLKSSQANSYGVNEEFIKHACSEFIQQSP